MGRPRMYTAKSLSAAVNKYFRSITRTVTLTEKKDSGERDRFGHAICTDAPILNDLGQEITVTEYVIPPTVGGLCAFLGIHRSTWADYCDESKYPEFSDTAMRARGRIHAYLEQESLTRSGKDLKGVLFNLENNFGYSEKLEVGGGIEEYLRQSAQEGEGQRF